MKFGNTNYENMSNASLILKWHLALNLKSASNLNGNLNCSKELEHYSS